jgi:phosphopantetheine adenylyltransferase
MAPLSGSSEHRESLLLLPPPPTDTSVEAYRAAYGPALEEVLTRLDQGATASRAHGLDIAIHCEYLEGPGFILPRRSTYATLQSVLFGIYRLIVHICAEKKIDLDREDKLDPRVVLLGKKDGPIEDTAYTRGAYTPQGPVVALQNLATSSREWKTVYTAESEKGESLLRKFTDIRRSGSSFHTVPQFEVVRVPGGTSIRMNEAANAAIRSSDRRHHSVAVGGTFDHLHLGHRLLLTATALVLDPPTSKERLQRSLVVGITGDELLKNKKYAEVLESWDCRQQAVYKFLSNIMVFDKEQCASVQTMSGSGPNENAVHYTFEDGLVIKCVEISDPFGPTITDESISGLIISGETRSGGKAVNDRRKERSWATLEVFEVDVLDANSEQEADTSSDFQSKLSSSEIRKRKLQEKTNSVL